MTLREYLFKHKMTQAEFARSINYNACYIREVIHKRQKAGKKLKKIIEAATNGEVSPEDV